MPFDKFFKADKRNFRLWLIVAGAIVLPVIGFLVYAPRDDKSIEPGRFAAASKLCANLPKPERFELINSQPPQFSRSSATVYYGYHSERNFDEIIPSFLVWFEANGWKRVAEYDFKSPVETQQPNRQLIFSKAPFVVNITYYYPNSLAYTPSANYQIACSFEEIISGR